jgi:hypothetical protein
VQVLFTTVNTARIPLFTCHQCCLATEPATAVSNDAELLLINRKEKDNKTEYQQAMYVGLCSFSFHSFLALQRCWICSPSQQEKVTSTHNKNGLVPLYDMS